MSYTPREYEQKVYGHHKYVNAQGNAECVEFVRQTTSAPHTTLWRKGLKVSEAQIGQIPRGTAIATFDDSGRYPTDQLGKHAAIYLGHDAQGITVLDQWKKQGEVKKRYIRFSNPTATSRSDMGNMFYVIE